jgi:hypothetical protein
MAKKIDGILTNLTSDKKCELFDFTLNEYLKGGFGSMNKSDIDALMYAVLQKSGMDELSDYDTSIELGLTKQRVRALQEKYSVRYDVIKEDVAIARFLEKLEYAKIEGSYIDIPIQDIALKNYLEAELDANNLLLQKQLNSNIFRLRSDDLLSFIDILEPEKEISKKVIAKIIEREGVLTKEGLGIDIKKGDVRTQLIAVLKSKGPRIAVQILAGLIPGGTIASTVIGAIASAV